jgi:hypothetical protein
LHAQQNATHETPHRTHRYLIQMLPIHLRSAKAGVWIITDPFLPQLSSRKTPGRWKGTMNASFAAKLTCADCGAPMDKVETVAVLASLVGHSIFECEWCGHITLLAKTAASAKNCDWLYASSARCQRGISRVSPFLIEALSA